MSEREIEIGRFVAVIRREFPTVETEMAKNISRGGKVDQSTSRLVCRCPDRATFNKLTGRFTRRWTSDSDTTVVFTF